MLERRGDDAYERALEPPPRRDAILPRPDDPSRSAGLRGIGLHGEARFVCDAGAHRTLRRTARPASTHRRLRLLRHRPSRGASTSSAAECAFEAGARQDPVCADAAPDAAADAESYYCAAAGSPRSHTRTIASQRRRTRRLIAMPLRIRGGVDHGSALELAVADGRRTGRHALPLVARFARSCASARAARRRRARYHRRWPGAGLHATRVPTTARTSPFGSSAVRRGCSAGARSPKEPGWRRRRRFGAARASRSSARRARASPEVHLGETEGRGGRGGRRQDATWLARGRGPRQACRRRRARASASRAA